MKIHVTIALACLLVLAFFVPQQSHAGVTNKQMALIGFGTLIVGFIGYHYLSTEADDDIEKDEIHSAPDKNLFKIKDYKNNKNEEPLPDIYLLKNTFKPEEYTQELKKLIEKKEIPLFMVAHILWIVNKKNLINDVLNCKFTTKTNEQATLLHIARGTWAEEVVNTEYENLAKQLLEAKNLNFEEQVL